MFLTRSAKSGAMMEGERRSRRLLAVGRLPACFADSGRDSARQQALRLPLLTLPAMLAGDVRPVIQLPAKAGFFAENARIFVTFGNILPR